MKKLFSLALLALCTAGASAQRVHSNMCLQPARGTQISFAWSDAGKTMPVAWGMDTAWDEEGNIRRGVSFIGADNLSTGRISFQPNDLIGDDGKLSATQLSALVSRLTHMRLTGVTHVELNCDHEVLNKGNYYGKPDEWVKVILATIRVAKQYGFNVVSVAPFNEPDYTAWGEGTKSHFRSICEKLAAEPEMEGIRICAGNTLNCDQAASWYDYMKPYIQEGNTHQLAGEFDSYAAFWQKVKGDGNVATADELHNVMEAIVGAEYGMDNGIWWGFDGVARGQLCRAHQQGGARLGYAEHRPSWTAGEVMRLPSGEVNAILGTSERQATDHSYNLVSTERPIYYDGYGPLQSFQTYMPGGTGYQQGQTNAERMLRLSSGADVQPYPIDGTYVVMNKKSKMVMTIAGGSTDNGAAVRQVAWKPTKPNTYQQWEIHPVNNRIGGDFSYWTITSARDTTMKLDLLNWSLDEGGTLCAYSGNIGANEQWYLQYAGNGDFYILSRHSALALEVKNGATTSGAAIQQAPLTGSDQQRWRLMPATAKAELDAPAAPQGLTATAQSASVRLQWEANSESDLAGYTVIRTADGMSDVIGRGVSGTTFVDNSARPGILYTYQVKAADLACNLSQPSAAATARVGQGHALVAHYTFDNTLADATENCMDAVSLTDPVYGNADVKQGDALLNMALGNNFVQLPPAVAQGDAFTFAAWVQTNATPNWQRIFDFGNDATHYLFLTPNSGSDMRFVVRNGGDEQMIIADKMSSGWHHVAVTLASDGAALYVDGEQKASSAAVTLTPADIRPALCYIGASQFEADPLYRGRIDDVRIYNYALTADEVAQAMQGIELGIIHTEADQAPTPYYNIRGQKVTPHTKGILIDKHGKKTVKK